MRTRVYRFLPEGVVDQLSAEARKLAWAKHYRPDVMTEILWQIERRIHLASDMVLGPKIHSGKLHYVDSNYHRYVSLADSCGIIVRGQSYSVLKNAKQYIFAGEILKRPLEQHEINDHLLQKKVVLADKRDFENLPRPTQERLVHIKEIHLDTVAARAWLPLYAEANKELPDREQTLKRHALQLGFERFAVGDYYMTKDVRSGREYTNIVNQPRDVRHQFLSHGGQHMTEVDIRTSQPRLLAVYLETEGFRGPELDKYKDFLAHDIYIVFCELWIQRYRGLITRDQMKLRFLTFLYDVPRENPSRFGRLFTAEFPLITKWIDEFKRCHGKSRLPIELCRIEARIIFSVTSRLGYAHYTVHDSIGIAADKEVEVEGLLNEELERHGVPPSAK